METIWASKFQTVITGGTWGVLMLQADNRTLTILLAMVRWHLIVGFWKEEPHRTLVWFATRGQQVENPLSFASAGALSDQAVTRDAELIDATIGITLDH